MITKEIFNSLKAGDVLQFTMRKRTDISSGGGCVTLQKVSDKRSYNDIHYSRTTYVYSDLKHSICAVMRKTPTCMVRIVFDKRNEEAQKILEKSRPNPEIKKMLEQSRK